MAASGPPRQFTMVAGQDIDPLFLCPICHDSWADPVELVPCGDIFCRACIHIARAKHAAQPMIMENFQCPQCYTVVQSEKKPNRMLLNTVLEVEVECRYCQWRGAREASSQHECEEGEKQKALEAATAPPPLPPLRSPSSTVPAPAKVHAHHRASATSPPPAEPISSPPGLRGGPRRAAQEIEVAFTAIEDDPSYSTLRAHTPLTSLSGVADSATVDILGGGIGIGIGGLGNRDQKLSSLTNPVLAITSASPPASPGNSGATPSTPGGSSPSMPTSATLAAEPWKRYRLSQVEYDQLVGIFMMYDEGTGRLTHRRLRDLCFCMNFVQREDDVAVIFRAMDSSHKGYVTQDDLLLWLSTHHPDPSALFGLTQFEYIDAILQFRSVDPEFNGVIDANGFCALCLTSGHARTADEAMRCFHLCDDRHTGYVSLQQYLRNLKAIKNGGGEGMLPRASSQPTQQQQQSQPSPLSPMGSGIDGGHGGPSSPRLSENQSNELAKPSLQQATSPQRFPPSYPTQQQQLMSTHSQRFVTSLNPLPGIAQQQKQQQPYSQMGRSTAPASRPMTTPQSGVAQQNKMQRLRSRLNHPTARPQRDEECTVM